MAQDSLWDFFINTRQSFPPWPMTFLLKGQYESCKGKWTSPWFRAAFIFKDKRRNLSADRKSPIIREFFFNTNMKFRKTHAAKLLSLKGFMKKYMLVKAKWIGSDISVRTWKQVSTEKRWEKKSEDRMWVDPLGVSAEPWQESESCYLQIIGSHCRLFGNKRNILWRTPGIRKRESGTDRERHIGRQLWHFSPNLRRGGWWKG